MITRKKYTGNKQEKIQEKILNITGKNTKQIKFKNVKKQL